jgi:hypothetical protein
MINEKELNNFLQYFTWSEILFNKEIALILECKPEIVYKSTSFSNDIGFLDYLKKEYKKLNIKFNDVHYDDISILLNPFKIIRNNKYLKEFNILNFYYVNNRHIYDNSKDELLKYLSDNKINNLESEFMKRKVSYILSYLSIDSFNFKKKLKEEFIDFDLE